MKKINTYSVKNWSEIPTVWKNTKEVKKVKYTNSPFDKELTNMLSPIAGDDDLRQIMNGVHFDDYGITATNAHILVSIPSPNDKFKGTYATIPKRSYIIGGDVKIKDSLFLSPKYPAYENIIPKQKDAYRTHKVNVYKILQWTEVALKYCNRGSFNVLYWFGDTSISFNAKYMIESMKLLLKLGHSEVYCSSSASNRAVVFSPDKKYELGKSIIMLLMPVMKNNGYSSKDESEDNIKGGSFDLDFSRELLAYYDFSTDEIRNSNDSVAEFKMFYGDYDVLPENEIKMLNKFAEKNTYPILDFFAVRNNHIHASDLASSLLIKHTDLEDGLYDVLDGAIELNEEMNSDEYPLAIKIEEPKIKFIIGSDVLYHYISIALKFVSKDDLRPQLTGIFFDYKDGKMNVVATNAHVLEKIDITKYIEVGKDQTDFNFIVNTNNLTKFFNNLESSAVIVSADKNNVSFENENYTFTSRLIDAKYSNYEGVISHFNENKLNLSKKELLDCINSDEAKKFIKDHKKQDIIIFDELGEEGRLDIYLGIADSYRREVGNVPIIEKAKVGNISYGTEEGAFQIIDSTLLIMPMALENVNLFAFNVKYLNSILDSLNCDSFDFLYKATNRGYFITGSCLNYGTVVKPTSSYKSTAKKTKKDSEIEELENLIELLKEMVSENPKDLDSTDALELYEETLGELKKVNDEKFEKGGKVGCGCKHSFEEGGEIKKDGTLSTGDHIQYEVDVHEINSKFNHKLYGTIEQIDDNEYYATYLNEIHFENEQEKEFNSLESAEKWVLSKINKDRDYYIKEFGNKFSEGGEIKKKKVIRRNLPINKEYKLVDSFYTGGIMDNPMSCENCGRIIANVAVIEDEDGKKYDVGMDCAETLSQIKNSLEFNIAQNDFAEANSIRTKVKNALKKYPDAKLTISNTIDGEVYVGVNGGRNSTLVRQWISKDLFNKYLPDFKNKISNPEKNGFIPKYVEDRDKNKLKIDIQRYKTRELMSPEDYLFDDYKAVVSRESVPNYNEETGEVRNYNNTIIIKVYKGNELIGTEKTYMAQDIPRDIFYAINKHDFENFKEQFKNGGYIQTLSYSEILKRLKDEFGIDESDGKSIHGSDLMRIIQVDKNLDPNSGMNLSKVLTDNGWTIIRDKYEQGGMIEQNGSKYFLKTFESKGNTWNVLFVWGRFNYVSVGKKTNNPFGSGIGKEFKNVDEAIAYYKNPDMKVQLIFAENEAKELGYVPKFENGGSIKSTSEELNKEAEDILRVGKIETDIRNEKDNTRTIIVEIKPNKEYALIVKKNGNVIKLAKGQNELSLLLNKDKYENGGEVEEKELYYAVYNEHTLGLLFINESGRNKLLVLHGSPLKGSPYTYMSMPLSISDQDLKQLRKATEKDFDEYRVALPPDFKKLNIDNFENGGYVNVPSEKVIEDFYKSIENNGANTTVGNYKKEGFLTEDAIDSLVGGYANGLSPKEKFELTNKIYRKGIDMQKGDVIYFDEKEYGKKYRGEILDVLNENEFLVSSGIKTFIVNKNDIIGLAPKKEDDLFNSGVSIYDERVTDINSTVFYTTYGVGNNPFEVNYDESNEYGYGIYFLDEKYSGIGKYNESRILAIKPNVKKPLIFLNDDGSSFNSQYKEAYEKAIKYDGVKNKDDFNKKMVELGYDSMLVSDIHGTHLIFFYNDPKLYSVKSDVGN